MAKMPGRDSEAKFDASPAARLAHVDHHAGYAAAKQKLHELTARRDLTERELTDALRAQAGLPQKELARKIDAALKDGQPMDADAAGARHIGGLRASLEVLQGACAKQSAEVRDQLALARAEVLAGLRLELPAIERSYFQQLIAFLATLDTREAWLQRAVEAGVPMHAAAGLAFFPCIAGAHERNSEAVASLVDGLRRGAIQPDEIPAKWRVALRERAAQPAPRLQTVRFLQRGEYPRDNYNRGEIAAFPAAEADELVKAGVAEYHRMTAAA